MAPLLMVFGCIGGGISMERYGRKFSQLLGYIPFIIGWILIALSENLNLIFVGRFLTGFCTGWLSASPLVYIAEISDPKIRGPLLACTSLAMSTGILIVHVLGTFLNWYVTATICACLPGVSFVILVMSPESPSWLLSQGRLREAATSFIQLRGSDKEACREFESMVKNQNISANVSNYSWTIFWTNIRKVGFVKPLLILSVFTFIMQFSGISAIIFYSITIFHHTFGLNLDGYLVMILVGIVRVIMSAVACAVLKKFGRKSVAIFSSLGTALSLFALSAFIYFSIHHEELQKIVWIPLILILIYIFFTNIGLIPIPWCMVGELFPLALRSLGSTIISSIFFLWVFVIVKITPALFQTYGAQGAFLFYGIVAFVGTVFLAVFLPETRNRTLQEIENDLRNRRDII